MRPMTGIAALKKSLLGQALLANSILVVATVTCLTVLFIVGLRSSLERQLELRAASVAESVGTQSQLALLVGDQAGLLQFARNALSNGDVVYVKVTDHTGVVTQASRADFTLADVPDLKPMLRQMEQLGPQLLHGPLARASARKRHRHPDRVPRVASPTRRTHGLSGRAFHERRYGEVIAGLRIADDGIDRVCDVCRQANRV